MNIVKIDQPLQLKQRYQRLKSQLTNPNIYPYVNTMLNLPAFVRENESLYAKLTTQLRQLRKNQVQQTAQKRQYKIKTTPFYLQSSITSNSTSKSEDVLTDMNSKNQILRTNIAQLRAENERKAASQIPRIREKQQELKDKKEEVQRLVELNRHMKRAVESQQLLELYEQKCRECESLRIVNNELSEQLKGVINQTNKLTGSQQNPNMFLLSMGIR